MEKLRSWINQTFGRRIAAFFIPVICILIIVAGGISSWIYYSASLSQNRQNTADIIRQGNYTLDLYFQDIKTTSVLLADNDDLIYMLTNYDEMTLQEKFYEQESVDQALKNTSLMRDHILDCIIIGLNGYQTNMPDRPDLKEDADLLRKDWMQPCVTDTGGGFYYTGAHPADYYYGQDENADNVLSVVFPVRPYGERIGYIIVDLDFQKMNDIISSGNNVNGLHFLVADSSGTIVFSDDTEEINAQLPQEAVDQMSTRESFSFRYQGRDVFCTCGESSTTNWRFLGLIPAENIMRPVIQMVRILAFVVLPVFIILAFVLSVIISGRVKKPLNEIVDQLEKIDIDHPRPFTVKDSVGEIDYLAEKITEMSSKITNLINQVYKSEIITKDAQIEALISQINPHFLYNTLQLIKTESVKGHSAEVSSTVNYLSRFLRYTINNRKLYVTLSEEIDYIRSYVEIYRKRFPGKYSLTIESDADAEQVMIPKLTLQPIVENSVKHGLRIKEGPGEIRITVKNGNDLTVIIEDNGNGMDPADIPGLLDRIHHPDTTGVHVGLSNIQERLELGGGSGYGITQIESRPGSYFRITLKIRKGENYV